jgi:hypothetical protein
MQDTDKKAFTDCFKAALAAKFMQWNEAALVSWWDILSGYNLDDVQAGMKYAARQAGFLDIANVLDEIARREREREMLRREEYAKKALPLPKKREVYDYDANTEGLKKLGELLDTMGVRRG